MTLSGTNYTDRHGRKLEVGQRVRIQECVGRYGQTAIRQGEITAISPYGSVTLKTELEFRQDMGRFGTQHRPVGSLVCVTVTRTGYEKFEDFEHGHEKWTEII